MKSYVCVVAALGLLAAVGLPLSSSGQSTPDLKFDLFFFSCDKSPCLKGTILKRSYTQSGPVNGGRLLPGLPLVAGGDVSGSLYAVYPQQIFKIDAATGAAKEIILPPTLPDTSWPMGMTLDTTSHRLLLATLGGEGYLYGCDPDTGAWTLVASMQNKDVDSIVYSPARDELFAFEVHRGTGPGRLFRLTPDGKPVDDIQLPPIPYDVGVAAHRSKLVAVDKYILLLIGPDARFGSGTPIDTRIYTIDPQSGSVELTYEKTELQGPVVSMLWPTNGASFEAGQNIVLRALASDPDYDLASVQFFANDRLLGRGNPLDSLKDGYAFLWTNAPAGTNSLTATATDSQSLATVSEPVQISVLAPFLPQILEQPKSQAIFEGNALTLRVSAKGGPDMKCSWRRDGLELPNRTNAVLQIGHIQLSDAGSYTVLVTSGGRSVLSDPATVTVLPVLVNHPASGERPAIASDGTNFLVVWSDYRNSGGNWRGSDIMGARVAVGSRVLDYEGIPIARTADTEWNPSVAFDGTNYLVVWAQSQAGSGPYYSDLRAARVSPEGKVIDATPIKITQGRQIFSPSLAFNGSHYLVIGYELWRNGSTGCELFGARVAPDGTVVDADGLLLQEDTNYLTPAIAASGGKWLVAWSGSGWGVDCRVVQADGSLGPVQRVVQHGVPALRGLTATPQGYFLASVDKDPMVGPPVTTAINGTFISSKGQPQQTFALASSTKGVVVDNPAVTWIGDGVVVAWEKGAVYTNGGYYPAGSDIIGMLINAAGPTPSFAISAGPGEQSLTALAQSRTHTMAVWRDGRLNPNSDPMMPDDYVIYGRQLYAARPIETPDGNGFLVSCTATPEPFIYWPPPEPIVYGTPLSTQQLNARVGGIYGKFEYSPPAGTVLGAGVQRLTATFTSAFPGLYGPASATVELIVEPAQLTVTADNKRRLCGSPNPPFTASYAGFIGSDNPASLEHPVSFECAAEPDSDPGAYPIVPGGASSPNYRIQFQNGTLTVLSREAFPPGSSDPGFDPTQGGKIIGLEGRQGIPFATSLQPDGKLILAGEFIGTGGMPEHHLARVLPDGSPDRNFRAWIGAGGRVHAVAVQPDGGLLLGGNFVEVNGQPKKALARLLPDGSLDPNFSPVIKGNVTETVKSVIVQPDGKILVGGDFVSVNGDMRFHVARLNPDGTTDAGFTPAPGEQWKYLQFNCLALQPNGQVLVGHATCQTDWAMQRLNADGALDTTFSLGVKLSNAGCSGVQSVAIQTDGKLLVLGSFLPATGSGASRRLARLNPDGSEDLSFSLAPVPFLITKILGLADDRIVIGGYAIEKPGILPNGIARLNPNGSLDPSFNAPESVLGHNSNAVQDFAARPDGRLMVAKVYDSFLGEGDHALVQLNWDGSLDPNFNFRMHASQATVMTILPLPGGKSIIGGQFSRLNDVERMGLAALDSDGSLDRSFGPPAERLTWVFALARQPDGKILVGGFFDSPLPAFANNLIRLYPGGGLDDSFAPAGLTGSIAALAVQPDGKILVGGTFTLPDKVSYCLVRLGPGGELDPTFVKGISALGEDASSVESITVLPDGKVMVGGEFSTYNDAPREGLARLNPDGTVDAGFVPDVPFVYAFAPDGHGKTLVLGSDIRRLNPDGSRDSNFMPPDFAGAGLYALAVELDGHILVGGTFRYPPGACQGRAVVRLNPNGSPDLSFNSTLQGDGYIRAVVSQPDGSVLIGGVFEEVNGLPCESITRLVSDPPAPSSCVRRSIDEYSVRLSAQPTAGTWVYAFEDTPPKNWGVLNITGGGIFDAVTGKVKFGPYFDDWPRHLTYEVVPPPGFIGVGMFSGTASEDGRSSPITGDDHIAVVSQHPADGNPFDWVMTMNEVTAYGAAWRTGGVWNLPPNPIPVDYVTRAASLWAHGERYILDLSQGDPPLCWVNELGIVIQGFGAEPGSPPSVTRKAPETFVPGDPVSVGIEVAGTSGVAGFAVEELCPKGCTVTSISEGGRFDAVNCMVKWGPFLDSSPRALSYEVIPTDIHDLALTGKGSFDGKGIPIAGSQVLQATRRLICEKASDGKRLKLQINGVPGSKWVLETSADLAKWQEMQSVTNVSGVVDLALPSDTASAQRYFRLKPRD